MLRMFIILLITLITSCSTKESVEQQIFKVDIENVDEKPKQCYFFYSYNTKSEDLKLCMKTIMIIHSIEILNNSEKYDEPLKTLEETVSNHINKNYPELNFKIEQITLL